MLCDAASNAELSLGQVLRGFVRLDLGESWGGQQLRLDALARLTHDENGKAYYALDVGGLVGRLYVSDDAQFTGAPRYLGYLGPNDDFRVAGWLRTVRESGNTHVELEIKPALKRVEPACWRRPETEPVVQVVPK